ncbi:Transmembrane protease serine 4 [Chelonia mydas]|uniref:Transmembrane protease serine 4 n=1 Tax=Chelonia mydas TaxID=8469 RepID=M7BZ64_CHEMY|nr:Transmembrane protease serine 4 [Chelonia mydas]
MDQLGQPFPKELSWDVGPKLGPGVALSRLQLGPSLGYSGPCRYVTGAPGPGASSSLPCTVSCCLHQSPVLANEPERQRFTPTLHRVRGSECLEPLRFGKCRAERKKRAVEPDTVTEPRQDTNSEWPLNRRGPPPPCKPLTGTQNFKRFGIPLIATILSMATIVVIAFLIKAVLERYYFLCSKTFKFIPTQQQCDGREDCSWGEDEETCVQQVPEGPPMEVRISKDRSTLQVLNKETGTWFWACHDNFHMTLAKAACKQMGYSSVPAFRAVDIADTQGLPLREVTLNNGVLQGQDSGRNNLALQNWRVKAGSEILSNFNTIPVEKIFIIDSNHMFPKDNDIALVKLTSPLSISDTVKPICLPFFDEELPSHAPLWVTGWGYTEQDGTLSKSLQQAQIKLIDSNTCNALDAYQGDISDTMICAGLMEGGVDTCQGDSGGPLTYNPGHWQVVGIVSWGHGCGGPSTPGVYTKVQAYLNWIYTVQRVSVLVSETRH